MLTFVLFACVLICVPCLWFFIGGRCILLTLMLLLFVVGLTCCVLYLIVFALGCLSVVCCL